MPHTAIRTSPVQGAAHAVVAPAAPRQGACTPSASSGFPPVLQTPCGVWVKASPICRGMFRVCDWSLKVAGQERRV